MLLAQFSPCVGFAIETFSNFQPAFLGGGMSVIPDGFIRGLNWKDELEQMDKMRTKGICASEIQKKQDLPFSQENSFEWESRDRRIHDTN